MLLSAADHSGAAWLLTGKPDKSCHFNKANGDDKVSSDGRLSSPVNAIIRAMNLLLLHPKDHLHGLHYQVGGRRARHIRSILGLGVGDRLRAGCADGDIGSAEIDNDDGEYLALRFTPLGPPPAPLPLTLILALPRPKMLKRILIDAASLGIKQIVLLNSWKVDKSYWQTPQLHADVLRDKLLLGLEQSGDTRLPQLLLEPRFKPFVEDRLPGLIGSSRAILADPAADQPLPCNLSEPLTLAIGPEGGWTDYELAQLRERGFQSGHFGARILRVETALPALVGRLMAPQSA